MRGRWSGSGSVWMIAMAATGAVAALGVGALRSADLDGARAMGLEAVERLGAEAGARQEALEFRWSGTVAAGRIVEIKGVNGPVEAEPATGGEVVVTAVKSARRSDPDEVRIEVIEHAGGVTVCAVYPSRGDRNRCEPGEGGRNEVRRNDVSVAFRVQVPEGVHFRGVTVNGGVGVRDLGGDVDVTTVNGDVNISTTGFALARTVNGSIRASMGSWSGDDVSFETVNGGIELDVPDDIDARVEARWVNGGLETDLPITLQGRMSRQRASGTLGDGGPELRLRTVNGSIRIR